MKKITLLVCCAFLTFCTVKTDKTENNIINLIKNNKILDIFSYINTNNIKMDSLFKDGKSLLHLAILYNNEDLLERLVEEGSPLNIQDDKGNTPLLYALVLGKKDIALNIIDLQPDFNITNKKGETPLIVATTKNMADVVRALIENRANPLIKNKQGKTAFNLAPQNAQFKEMLGTYTQNYKVKAE